MPNNPDWFQEGASAQDHEFLGIAPVEYVPTPDEEVVEDESPSVIVDMLKQVPAGATRGVDQTLDFLTGWMSPVDYIPKTDEETGFGLEGSAATPLQSYDWTWEPKTIAGGLTGNLSQFAGGMLIGGAIVKGVRAAALPLMTRSAAGLSLINRGRAVAQNVHPWALKTGQAALKGSLGDFLAFAPNEERLSNLAAEMDIGVLGPLVDYLAADEDDGQFEGRLKNAIEGAILGVAVDTVLGGLKGIRSKMRSNSPKDAREAFKSLEDVMDNLKGSQARSVKVRQALREALTPEQASDETVDAIATIWDNLATRGLKMDPDEAWEAKVAGIRRQAGTNRVNPGSIEFMEDGKVLIKLYENADVSTVIHEVGHLARRNLDEVNTRILTNYYTKNGKWTIQAEEKFAKDWESYIYNGIGPTREVSTIFKRIKGFFAGLTKDLKTRYKRIHPNVSKVLDDVLGGDDPLRPLWREVDDSLGSVIGRIDGGATLKDMEDNWVVREAGEDTLGREVREGQARTVGSLEEALETTGIPRTLIDKALEIFKTVDPTEVDPNKYLNAIRNGLSSESPDDVLRVVEAFGAVIEPTLARNEVLRNKIIEETAAEWGKSVDDLKKAEYILRSVVGSAHDTFTALQTVRNARIVALEMAAEFGRKIVDAGHVMTDVERIQAYQLLAEFMRLDTLAKDAGSYFGRGLQLHNLMASTRNAEFMNRVRRGEVDIREYRAVFGTDEEIKELFQTIVTQKDAKATDLLRKRLEGRSKAMSIFQQIMYGALLSGFKTHATNYINNMAMNVLNPIERSIGGFTSRVIPKRVLEVAIGAKLSPEDARRLALQGKQGIRQLTGVLMATGMAHKAAWERLRNPRGGARTLAGPGGVTKIDAPDQVFGGLGRKVNKALSWPTRLLEAEDVAGSRMAQYGYVFAEMLERVDGNRGMAKQLTDRLFRLNDFTNDMLQSNRDFISSEILEQARRGELTGDQAAELFRQLDNQTTIPGALKAFETGEFQAMQETLSRSRNPQTQEILDQYRQIPEDLELINKALNSSQDAEDIIADAMWWAEEANFTRKLNPNTIASGIQGIQLRHPMVRLVLPFVKTPANILRAFFEHTPVLGMLMLRFRKAAREEIFETIARDMDGLTKDINSVRHHDRLAQIIGRQVAGLSMAIGAYGLWESGILTGYGPDDEEERSRWLAAGNRPMALTIPGTDVNVSLSRLSPFGQLLGFFVETFEGVEKGTAEDMADHFFKGFKGSVMDQSFFVGFKHIVDLANDPRNVTKWAVNTTSAMVVPYSSLFKQTTDAITGGELYRSDGGFETLIGRAVAQRAFGFWGDLGVPMYDLDGNVMRKGNLINNVVLDNSEMSQDPATLELAKLTGGIRFDDPKSMFSLNFSNLDRDQAVRLKAEIGRLALTIRRPSDNKTLHEALNELIASDAYQAQTPLSAFPGDNSDTPRGTMIRRLVSAYQDAAKKQLASEDEDLKKALILNKQVIMNRRRGVVTDERDAQDNIMGLIGR